jgi:2-keto-4-pentenoate hydratase/2-oxohepta-3-ene-1,7-dioic acid hydratase in catechol pathway
LTRDRRDEHHPARICRFGGRPEGHSDMRFASFRRRDEAPAYPHAGLIDPVSRRLWPVADLTGGKADDMWSLIEGYDGLRSRLQPAGSGLALEGISLLAPIPRPRRNIFCVGKNYREHVLERPETGGEIPEAPVIFTKAPSCVVADGEPIRIPAAVSRAIDYEAELAVVIGRGGRAIEPEQAFAHVWGYTVLNDVTARDLQLKHKQWFLGKSIDGFCPMGPWLVTADTFDPRDLAIRCWINGELRQDARTSQLIFDIPTLIATISAAIALEPGDVIATGTPGGVGAGFKPPRYLAPGDRVRIEIEGIGRLENPVA